MSHAHSERSFLPAAGWDLLLPLYDAFTRLIGGDAVRAKLIEDAGLERGHDVLDIGCGTGSLVVECRRRQPGIAITGLDPDPKALARARRKAERAGVTVRFDRGFADALPYDDASFDRVLSSLMFHHLEPDDKAKALLEIRRVLKPEGRLELVDFVGPHDVGGSGLQRWLHRHPRFEDSAGDHVLALMTEAGLARPSIVARSRTLVGSVAFYRAHRNA